MDNRYEFDLVGSLAFRIQEELIPTDDRQLGSRRGGRTEPFSSWSREQFQADIERRYPLRNGNMERIHLNVITLPFDRFAAGAEFESGNIRNRSCGCVFARDPFRKHQCQRPRRHRNGLFGVKDFSRRLSRINPQHYRRAKRGSGEAENRHNDMKAEVAEPTGGKEIAKRCTARTGRWARN